MIIHLGSKPVIQRPGYDLVYYERENPPGMISMNWVIVDVSTSPGGPWTTVFNWGDNIIDSNTNIGVAGYGATGEADNQQIPLSVLYGSGAFKTGVEIDINGLVPPGVYHWVRISSPAGVNHDPAEVDAIEVLP
jgi:hypothetical protein